MCCLDGMKGVQETSLAIGEQNNTISLKAFDQKKTVEMHKLR